MCQKIGLTQRVAVIESYNERRDCLDQAWTSWLEALGYLPVPLPNRITDVNQLVIANGLTGIILTGGNDLSDLPGAVNTAPERDAFEQRLLEVAADHDIPVLGVCRGLQLMVRHYGGRLTRLCGHVGITHPIIAADNPFTSFHHRDEVNSYHSFGVNDQDLGTALHVLARATDGTVEAVVHRDLPQWGIMWHPERVPVSNADQHLMELIFRPGI